MARGRNAFGVLCGLGMALGLCGIGSGTAAAANYVLTVNSTNPASGVAIAVTPADTNKAANGSTSFTRVYAPGTVVYLTAPAKAGSNPFVAWTGCAVVSGVVCKVTLNATTTVTATYAQTYTLTVNSTNPASGAAIGVSPADINKAANGTTSLARLYAAGTVVTLTAPARSGINPFVSWTGCTSATTVTCKVTLNSNTTVTANYAQAYALTVQSTNPASGVAIGVFPADVNSAAAGSTMLTRIYKAGTVVTLTAAAKAGNNPFSAWTGCDLVSAVTCRLTIRANRTVAANYSATRVLTVLSANPASGVAIAAAPADTNKAAGGSTTFTRVYLTGTAVTLTAPAKVGNNPFASWAGCTSVATVTCKVTLNGNLTVRANYAPTFTLTVNSVNPASGVAVGVTPADNNKLSSGTTSFTRIYNAGTAVTLTAPAKAGSYPFTAWTGCTSAATVTCKVTVLANATVTASFSTLATPTVAVTPSAATIATAQALTVTVKVAGPTGKPTPTGSVKLTGGGYTSSATALASGGATFTVAAGALAAGTDTLSVAYTPDTAGAANYAAASGAASVKVVAGSAIAIDQTSIGPPVTNQLMGMNMAAWTDPTTAAFVPAFETAGIKVVRWPGGSWSDAYHWATNSLCGGYPNSNATYDNFVNDLAIPANLDVALTANYGSNAACTGPGDPAEAASWLTYAKSHGGRVSHMTVGNEEYGGWEMDLHTLKNDASTYAGAAANGFYPALKQADPNVLVGVSVNPGNYPAWDPTVLANAKYDFVEYHYYPQAPGYESDTFLVQQAAQGLTQNIKTIKAELATAGHPDTPIYVGEIGSVYTNPGKQSTSITQALYAGQVLGELMNDGVARATWWIGFGGCGDSSSGNFSSSLYGWQNFGGYMVFSDGTPEYGCANATPVPVGTLLPTARAFQLFGKMAINGESVLTASVAGDATDVRAYAATNSGGTALLLFNLNETVAQTVVVTLSKQTASSGVTVETYNKALYDQSKNNVWAAPTTVSLGAQSLPLTLTLTPWSMNVVIVK